MVYKHMVYKHMVYGTLWALRTSCRAMSMAQSFSWLVLICANWFAPSGLVCSSI